MGFLGEMIEDHASDILFGAGLGGLAVTVACTAKDTKSYIQDETTPETFWGKVRLAVKHYRKTAVAVAITIAGFSFSKALDGAENAILGAALGAMTASRKDILKKTDELYGEGAANEVTKDVAKDKIEGEALKYHTEPGEILCYFPEEFGGGVFVSTELDIMDGFLELNHGLNDYSGGYYYGSTTALGLLNRIDIHDQLPNKEYGRVFQWDAAEMVEEYDDCWVDYWLDPIEDQDYGTVFYIRFSYDPVAYD